MPSATVERLRPAALRSKPVRVPRVFDDPDSVLRLIRERGPYPTFIAHHHMEDTMNFGGVFPWFLAGFDDDVFLHIPSFLAAAREAFSAQIVQPTSCTLNLNGPMKSSPPHVDLPVFRGFAAPAVPIWLLMNMSYAGMFHPWMVPVASGLVWFYRGEGGAFDYWADGPNAAPLREAPPMWNVGVMSDNEFMWHRVAAMGPPADRDRLHGHLRTSDKLYYVGDGAWEIRDGERIVAHLAASAVRISLLWKAYAFKDEEHLTSFKNPAMDLDVDQVLDMYLDDLDRRGEKTQRPAAPFEDPAWRHLLQRVYMPPFDSGSRQG